MNYSFLNNEIDNKTSYSDNQGLEYKRKHNSITKEMNEFKEGFENPTDKPMVNAKNKKEIDELIKLQNNYNAKLSDYANAYKLVMNNANAYFDMLKSPLLNKNIRLNDGTIGYVTSMGIFRPYPSMFTFNQVAGKRGCPSDWVQVDAIISNNKVTTNPPFTVGRQMAANNSCGNEGKNVIASNTGIPGQHKYQGCYRVPKDSTALIYQDALGSNTTIDACKQLAHDSGSSVFALSGGGLEASKCYIGNDLDKVNSNVTSVDSIVSWESPTNLTSIYARLNYAGQLTINGFKQGNSSNIKEGLLYKVVNGYMNDDPNFFVKNQASTTGIVSDLTNITTSTGGYLNNKSTKVSVEWVGYFKPNITGKWLFSLRTDNCSFMWLGDSAKSNYSVNNTFINNKGLHAPVEKTASMSLIKDVYYPIRIQFGQNMGGTRFTLTFSSPSGVTRSNGNYFFNTPNPFNDELIIPISDTNDAVLWESNPPQGGCNADFGGKVILDTATYGENCNYTRGPQGQSYYVPTGNAYEHVQSTLNNTDTYTIGRGFSNDVAPGCPKGFTSSYKCGNGATKLVDIAGEAGGKLVKFDCSNEMNKCNAYFLNVQDDGNLVIYGEKRSVIWNSNTYNKVDTINEEKKAINGKYKRSFLKPGETLNDGEFVGSTNGKCCLQMIKGRGLVLMYFTSNCKLIQNNTYGIKDLPGNLTMATYSMPVNDMSNYNKIAYISGDGIRREYTSDLLSKSSDYINIGNFKQDGNTLRTVKGNFEVCRTECNKDPNCDGFVFDNETCQLRDSSNMFPKVKRYSNANSTLYKRISNVKNNSSCNKKLFQTSTSTYGGYNKGVNVNMKQECGLASLNKTSRQQLDTKLNELTQIVNTINSKVNNLSDTDKKLLESYGFNQNKINNSIMSLGLLQQKYLGSKPQLETATGMVDNSENDMLSKTYYHILWSILAIMIVIGGIKMARN